MKTIVFAATKGGTGKTSLAFNVAIEASKSHQVLIADLDPQRSLKGIWQKRGEMLNPRLVSNVSVLAQSIKLLAEAGYDREYMVVDTPGSMMAVIRDAIAAADLLVLPVQPSPMDWAAQEALCDLADEMGMRDRTLIVINRAEGRSDLVDRTREFFQMRTPFAMPVVKDRVEYKRGIEVGKAATEMTTNKDYQKEIRDLWQAIKAAIETKASRKEARDERRVH